MNLENTLTEKEKQYWYMMKPRSGVLFIQGRPGEGKTAIIETIARKLGYQYFDLRLSQMDETDVGLYPYNKNNEMIVHIPPQWAILANKKPTIIVFEELNRARLNIRNAAMQILQERRIGYDFKFNDKVYMCATGNLGDKDGTTVEEFDTALWNRLLPVEHTLTIKEWEDGFAKENIWEPILSFIKTHPEHFYKEQNENSKAYATARSWTFLSDRLKNELGDSITFEDSIAICKKQGMSYVGNSIIPFIRYLEDQSLLNIRNIIEEFEKYSNQIKKLNRAKRSELLVELKHIEISKINNEDYINNIIKFLELIDEDERVSYIFNLIDKEVKSDDNIINDHVKKIVKHFKDELEFIKKNFVNKISN